MKLSMKRLIFLILLVLSISSISNAQYYPYIPRLTNLSNTWTEEQDFTTIKFDRPYIGNSNDLPIILYVGDSHTASRYYQYITEPVYNILTYDTLGIGINGKMVSEFDSLYGETIGRNFANNAGQNIIVLYGGTNDITRSYASQKAYGRIEAFANKYRNLGWKIIVCTLPAIRDYNAERDTVNKLIRNNWTKFADGIADLGGDAVIGYDNADTNTTYFTPEGIHFTTAGYQRIASIVEDALYELCLFGNTKYGSAFYNSDYRKYSSLRFLGVNEDTIGFFTNNTIRMAIDSAGTIHNNGDTYIYDRNSYEDGTSNYRRIMVGFQTDSIGYIGLQNTGEYTATALRVVGQSSLLLGINIGTTAEITPTQLLPNNNNGQYFGDATKYWREGYITGLYADSAVVKVYKQASVVTIADSVINCNLSNTFQKTLGANQRFVISNIGDGQTINIAVTNTASNYTVTWVDPDGLTIKWADSSTPVQTVGAKTDVWTFVRIGTVIYGNVIQNF